MLGGPSVVQHCQHPSVGEHAAVERGLRVDLRRDTFRGDAESLKEVVQCLSGVQRFTGVEAAQVHVQVSVGEAVLHLMRPVQRE